MRVLGFVVMLVVVLTGPSLAGANDGDLPGIGTFTYNGSAVSTPAPMAMAAADVGR